MSLLKKHNDSIELFCGTGGLALGLQQAGFDHKALYELDHNSCENIRANIERGFSGIQDWKVIQTDVRSVSYNDFNHKIKLVSGGPPCQPFSLGGNAEANNDHRDMFPEAVRAIREIKPEAFIFENVKGLLRKSFAPYFTYILLQLRYPSIEKLKDQSWEEHRALLERYHTSTHHYDGDYNVLFRLVNTADYGIPQTRQRVIIVGFRSDINANWSFPEPTHSKEALLNSKWISGEYWDKHNLKKPELNPLTTSKEKEIRKYFDQTNTPKLPWLTVRDALCDLPEPKKTESEGILNHTLRVGAKSYPGHTGSRMDEPSKTIKAGVHGVPGGENTIVLDNGKLRYYTIRECARIQTFPDNFNFMTSWSESVRQIGNAVPVHLAKILGNSIYNHLNIII